MKKRIPSETDVEEYLTSEIRGVGGECLKWTSPAMRGVPDRLIFLPGRLFEIVETKTKGGTLDPIQRVVHKLLAKVGFVVWVIWTYEQVDDFMTYVKLKIRG